ncbi:MAG: hypothetical protein R3236_03395 [Phycisphaeraceae bacterium]|nr:hypothetical protein [Phycisphaeraceae bacterium]
MSIEENSAVEQIDLSEEAIGPGEGLASKIKRFDAPLNSESQAQWKRPLKPTGQGAFRVRTFYGRLREEGLEALDRQINEWFDANPEYEIKNVTTTVGQMVSYKTSEPALIVNIWM